MLFLCVNCLCLRIICKKINKILSNGVNIELGVFDNLNK